jgi:hypothetical protein
LLGIASVLAFLCLGFVGLAIDQGLTDLIGAPAAAAATAGLLGLTALAMVGIAALVPAFGSKAAPLEPSGESANITDLATALIDLSQKLDGEVRSSLKPLTIAALIFGCAVGYSPALRRTLKDFVG